MSTIYFFAPQVGLVLKDESEAFDLLENDHKKRMWLIVAYRCMINNVRKWETRTALQALTTRKIKTSVLRLCLRFSCRIWPEIHHVKQELLLIPEKL